MISEEMIKMKNSFSKLVALCFAFIAFNANSQLTLTGPDNNQTNPLDCGTISAITLNFTDGAGNYTSNMNETIVFCPDLTQGTKVSIAFATTSSRPRCASCRASTPTNRLRCGAPGPRRAGAAAGRPLRPIHAKTIRPSTSRPGERARPRPAPAAPGTAETAPASRPACQPDAGR